jgi:Mg-chelatase subunit ChlD
MSLTWTAFGWLWLLLLVPAIWVVLRWSRINFNVRQRRVQAAVRSLVLVALALALARPVLSTGSSRLSIVYLVDISHSIAPRAIDEAAGQIDEFNRVARPAHSRIVAFGTDVTVLDSATDLRRLVDAPVPAAGAPTLVNRSGSDLETGLAAARAELAPGHVPRIVLFSDGRATAGDVHEAVSRLAAEGVPVFVVPLAVRDIGDAWVDSVGVPEHVSAGALFKVTVGIGSQRGTAGLVELRSGTRVIASQAVALAAGFTTVTLDGSVTQPGSQTLEAVLSVPGDPVAANNQLAHPMWVNPRARVMYVEGTAPSARYLTGALTESGFEVSVQPPADLPSRAADFAPYDVVILSDVSRKFISDASMTAIAEWVEKAGGGLLVAGGESVFGEGGYRKTELERLTPVTFERRDEPEIALIIVLDKSWSMAGQQMELCKAAAQAAIDVLADEQSVGVLTFNDELNWDVTLRNVGKNRDAIRKAVAAIEPSGHTLIYPAIEQAYNALKNAKARAKHVVLLSDGRSIPDDYEGLVKKMVGERMTVSTIAVGPAADAELLGNIATWGRGRSYVVQDAREVPQIFVKEAKDVPTPAFDEKAILPVVKNVAFLDGVDMTHAPALKGRTATVLKDAALQVLATPDNDPLLAFWPIGLGRAAVFASDVKDRWAADWLGWREYGPFFSAVVRAIERQRPAAMTLDLMAEPVRGSTRGVTVSIDARDATGGYRDLLRPVVRVRSGTGASEDLTARQVAPGRYQAHLVVDATEALTVELAGADAGVTSRLIVPDEAEEYRFRPVDENLLQSIAAATGGTWKPAPAALANAAGAHQTARRPLWPGLVIAALALWFVDLLLRRVRVFEPA